eukprot:TRINITY_DN2324_c0_g1_i8.p1 TRINITY_DN2324_c0_g1~~TRINITY_DN2324_c0_g1_i8.p1  ORF type:complete len:1110 (-),score=359.38 TRINITY_DN2324_c0_g1_i8:251-3580(-)
MAHLQKFAELLKALISANNDERQQAENLYQQAKAGEPEQLYIGLLGVLATDAADQAIRSQAAVLLRQLSTRGTDKDFVFGRLSPDTRGKAAAELLARFEGEQNAKLQTKVGDVISRLAECVCDTDDNKGWLSPAGAGWPALLPQCFRMADPAQNANAASCESSIRLLKKLVPTMKAGIVQAQQALGSVLQNAFAHPEPKIKIAAVLLVCEIVSCVEKKEWAPLMATATVMTQILQQVAQAKLQDDLQELLQAFVEIAEVEPDFYKQQLQSSLEPAKTMSLLVKTKEVEEGVRNLALEWIVSYVEKKNKWCTKHLPALPALAIECCMDLMLEIDDSEDELKAWAERMDDEEGEEDADELFHGGEQAIDRVVENMTMENIGTALFAVIGKYSQVEKWQAKHAALAAIKQTVEYVEEAEHVNEMAKLLLAHVDHAHPRVRYTALHAIGQLSNDQSPHFQEAHHAVVMPQLLRKMDDPVDRVAAMAMSAFVSFGEELDNALMVQYAQGFMQKLVGRLQSSKHRMVQEESITCIAVIAAVIEKDFAAYYDGMMPLLKQFVMTATGEKQGRLRGKAFECMSLLGTSVGKEKFLPDAREAIAEMMKAPMEGDDLQREYIHEASERIVKVLKADFKPFLHAMLPGIYKSLQLENSDVAPTGKTDDDDDGVITIQNAEGKLVKVQTSKFEEATQSVNLLWTIASEMEGAFLEFIQPTAQALLPFLDANNDLTVLCDEARGAAFQAWAMLIKSAKHAGQVDLAKELLRTFMQKIMAVLEADSSDPDALREAADGIAECLKNVGPGALAGDEVLQIVRKLFGLIEESSKRSAEEESEKKKEKAGAPPELQGDDEEEEDEEGDEEACRYSLQEALAAVMEVAPQDFLQILPEVGQRMQQWLGSKLDRCTGLYLACNVIKVLKDASQQLWPICMPAVFQALGDKDPEMRIPACWAINLAAPLPAFAEAAPEAFQKLAQLVGGKAPKKRDDRAKVAVENAVAALLSLAKEKASLCPPAVQPWQLVVSKLPLSEDEDEAKKVHKVVVDLVLAQNAGLLGPDNAHLGKLLSAFAEIYKQESNSETETDEKIKKIFQSISQDQLRTLASSFTEKQMKKIERMLSSP